MRTHFWAVTRLGRPHARPDHPHPPPTRIISWGIDPPEYAVGKRDVT